MNQPIMAAADATLLERIKLATLRALFSDDELMEQLVLKGGNALALIYKMNARSSVDLDFSLADEFTTPPEELATRIEKLLQAEFHTLNLMVFDVKVEKAPKKLSVDLADFWGGYQCDFKLVTAETWKKHSDNIDALRRNSILIGQQGKFLIDFSCHEYVAPKQEIDLDGLTIYAYSLDMIAAEKLRAICQQDPAYAPIVKRGNRDGSPRARDFFDLYRLVTERGVTVSAQSFQHLLPLVFDAKKVPLGILGKVAEQRDFHRRDFPAVQATITGPRDKTFDEYFDFVLDLIEQLKPVWDK